MLLENKNAIIYGTGGSIGGAAARTFAREGARVFLAGRTRTSLDAVAVDIAAAHNLLAQALSGPAWMFVRVWQRCAGEIAADLGVARPVVAPGR